MIKTYYVYIHKRKSTGEIFYVGKGTNSKKHGYDRAHATKGRNRHWKNIVAKFGHTVEVIREFNDESDAFTFEKELIAEYGRRLDGGILCNLTIGGEGESGYSPTAETRKKLSEMFSGERHPNFGKKLTQETCRKKSESMKASSKNLKGKKLPEWWKEKIAATKVGDKNPMYGKISPRAKPIIDIQAGVFYNSVQEAADHLGYKMQTLWAILKGINPNNTSLRFA